MAKVLLSLTVVLSGVVALATSAGADPCGTTPGLDTNEVTFRGVESQNCAGVIEGNLVASDAPVTFFGIQFDTGLDEGGSVVVDGVTFSLSDAPEDTSGNWTLTFTSDPDTTVTEDLLVALKPSNRYAVYLFNDEVFNTDGSGTGTFSISFLNNGGQTPDLSHMTVFFGGGTTPSVPEPATMLLLGAGLLGTTIIARRRAR